MKSLAHSSFLKKCAAVQSILKVNERGFFFKFQNMYANFSWQCVHRPYLINTSIWKQCSMSTVKQPMNGNFALIEITAVYLLVLQNAVRVVIFPESLIQPYNFTPQQTICMANWGRGGGLQRYLSIYFYCYDLLKPCSSSSQWKTA